MCLGPVCLGLRVWLSESLSRLSRNWAGTCGRRREMATLVYYNLLLTSFLRDTCDCSASHIWDRQTSHSYQVSRETLLSLCHALSFVVHAQFSQESHVIPCPTKEWQQWCSAPAQLILINPYMLVTPEWHLGKTKQEHDAVFLTIKLLRVLGTV